MAHGGNQEMGGRRGRGGGARREEEDDADDEAVAEAFADAVAEQRDDEEEEAAAAAAAQSADDTELSAGAGAAAAAAIMPAHQTVEDQRAAVRTARRELAAHRAAIRKQLPPCLRLTKNALSIRDSYHKTRATSNSPGSAFHSETLAEREEDAADAAAAAAAATADGAAPVARNGRAAAQMVQCPLIMAMKSGTKKQCQTTYQISSVAALKKHLASHVTSVMASAYWAREHPHLVDLLYAQCKILNFRPFELTPEQAETVARESDAP